MTVFGIAAHIFLQSEESVVDKPVNATFQKASQLNWQEQSEIYTWQSVTSMS